MPHILASCLEVTVTEPKLAVICQGQLCYRHPKYRERVEHGTSTRSSANVPKALRLEEQSENYPITYPSATECRIRMSTCAPAESQYTPKSGIR